MLLKNNYSQPTFQVEDLNSIIFSEIVSRAVNRLVSARETRTEGPGWVACWLAGCLSCWLADQLASWLPVTLAFWLVGSCACWLIGFLAYWAWPLSLSVFSFFLFLFVRLFFIFSISSNLGKFNAYIYFLLTTQFGHLVIPTKALLDNVSEK